MFWRMVCGPALEGAIEDADGRFVIHRHRDGDGEHLDLRLERDGYLVGWRIDRTDLEEEAWATEKGPHPVRWLDERTDASIEDAGVYTWERLGPDRGVLRLQGREGVRAIQLERETRITPAAARALAEAMDSSGVNACDGAKLMADGAAARSRATARLIGLGHELDGAAFDGELWRRQLAGLSLDEIHAQLRAFETRFDAKYPPGPVSQPESLPEDEAGNRTDAALAILRGK